MPKSFITVKMTKNEQGKIFYFERYNSKFTRITHWDYQYHLKHIEIAINKKYDDMGNVVYFEYDLNEDINLKDSKKEKFIFYRSIAIIIGSIIIIIILLITAVVLILSP
jgi:hypothetical protein